MTKVKICGFTEETTLRAAAEAGADWIGLNTVEASPRCVLVDGPDRMARLRTLAATAHDLGIGVVVLVANAPKAFTDDVIAAAWPGALQCHGAETANEIEAIRAALSPDVEVWKAVGVSASVNLDDARQYSGADRVLLDAKPPDGAAQTGGHGRKFDWSLLDAWATEKPWLLAGGLTPGNVADAIRDTGADAVDVSSGVERVRGVKDADLIRQFVSAAKGQ